MLQKPTKKRRDSASLFQMTKNLQCLHTNWRHTTFSNIAFVCSQQITNKNTWILYIPQDHDMHSFHRNVHRSCSKFILSKCSLTLFCALKAYFSQLIIFRLFLLWYRFWNCRRYRLNNFLNISVGISRIASDRSFYCKSMVRVTYFHVVESLNVDFQQLPYPYWTSENQFLNYCPIPLFMKLI